jgi:hypothetical protein
MVISIYIILNKIIKKHNMKKFISSGIKRLVDRILFTTVIIVSALFGSQKINEVPGLLLLISSMFIGYYNCHCVEHYYAAIAICIIVFYIIIRNANIRNFFDYLIILSLTIFFGILIFYLIEQKIDSFISIIEHLAFIVAAIFICFKTRNGEILR